MFEDEKVESISKDIINGADNSINIACSKNVFNDRDFWSDYVRCESVKCKHLLIRSCIGGFNI